MFYWIQKTPGGSYGAYSKKEYCTDTASHVYPLHSSPVKLVIVFSLFLLFELSFFLPYY